MNIYEEINKIGVVPVIALDDPNYAGDLANALCDGGLPVAEVTFRVDNVAQVMKAMVDARPEILLGAGTVLTKEQVDSAIECGCKFIVSPGLNPEITKYCQEKGIPHVPGIATPSELELALSLGLEYVKFFPAELNGGLPYIKGLCGPYKNVSFMPTGGVNTSNLKEYLAFDRIFAAGGT